MYLFFELKQVFRKRFLFIIVYIGILILFISCNCFEMYAFYINISKIYIYIPLQDYSMDCYFRQYWRDTRLSFLGPIRSLSLSIKMLERIWRPDTYFYNGKHSYVHTITVPNKLLRISQHGDILYSMRYDFVYNCH